MNNKAIIDLCSLALVSRPEWNQIEYASITGTFPLQGGREGKVKLIMTAQRMLPTNYSRDLTSRVTH